MTKEFSLGNSFSKQCALLRCAACGSCCLDPQPTPSELTEYYDTEYYGSDRKKFVGPVARLVGWFQGGRSRCVARRIQKPGPILDIGCGNGGFLAQMHELGYQVEGTELSKESAARVPQQIRPSIHVGDLGTLDLVADQYKAVTLWHVFEHLSDPHSSCKIVHKILNKGGLLFLSLPNQDSWQARLFRSHWFHLDPPRHLFGFGPKSLTRMLEDTGFAVRETSTWSLEQNPYGLAQSLLNAIGFKRDRAYTMLKGQSKAGIASRLLDLFLLAMLCVPSLIVSSVASLLGRGATMQIIAEKI